MEAFLNPRKRRRDDLICDLAPLTKRFKDLNQNLDGGESNYPTKYDYIDAARCDAGCPAAAYNDYSPELGNEQNPVYYEKNRVLYDLHAARVRRHCQCAVHNGCELIVANHIKTAVEI